MKPQTIGRVLGIGVRVVGRMAGQRLSGSAQTQAASPAGSRIPQPVTIDGATARRVGPVGRSTSQGAARVSGSLARGLGGFLRPFGRIGGILFLEVVGVFFFVFVLVFGNWAWRLRPQAGAGTEHAKFLLYVAMALLFLYLSVSSFWRARRK